MDGLQDYREQTAVMDRAAFLGRLCWYEVTETHVPHTALAERMKLGGLDAYIPPAPRDDDVFRRVFHNGQRKKVATDDTEVIVNYLIRELTRGEGTIVKRVVVEQVDRRGKRLDYSEVLEVVFASDHPGQVKVVPIGGRFDPTALTLVSELADRFKATRGTINGQGVRDLLLRILRTSKATAVRAGVYFVPEDRADTVSAVEALGSVIPGCQVDSVELIDTGKQRDMLRRSFEAESIGEIDRMMAEMAELDEVTPRKAEYYAERYAALQSKTAEYETLLSESLSTTEFRLRLFEQHMAQLSAKVVKPTRQRRSA